jgi:threonine/homoserine/homoserine lactone efflux protein
MSIPVAGPIAALVVTKSLENKLRFARRVAAGASFVEFFYVFVAMFGVTFLMKFYKPFIPYLFMAGGALILFAAYKIYKTEFKIKKINSGKNEEVEEAKQRGGFRTGAVINATNPTLFFGWLTTSFIILSFASSVGLDTGGLDVLIQENIAEISQYTDTNLQSLEEQKLIEQRANTDKIHKNNPKPEHAVTLSFFYAFAVSIGGFVWFYLFSSLINKHRGKINIDLLNGFIKIMSIFLVGLAIYFIFMGVKLLV